MSASMAEIVGAVDVVSFGPSGPPNVESLEYSDRYQEALRQSLLALQSVREALSHIPLGDNSAASSLGLGASFSWVEGAHVISVRPRPALESRFNRLAQRWRKETISLSSPMDRFSHPLYLQIIGMGKEIIPLLLGEVERMSDSWFLALRSITQADPATERDSSSVRDLAAAWLRWGRQHGYDVAFRQPISTGPLEESEFDRQKRSFLAIPQAQREGYTGRFVASRNGVIVDDDTDLVNLSHRFFGRYGKVPVYITRVGKPIRMRSPFTRKKR